MKQQGNDGLHTSCGEGGQERMLVQVKDGSGVMTTQGESVH